MMPHAERYEDACEVLAIRIRRWRAENPDAAPIVGFTYPKTVFLIAALSDALPSGLVDANEDGRRLIGACVAGYAPKEMPTVALFRAAWEHVEAS